ncbi:hypothetical protein SAMN05192529_11012 [Arachidicoccus rhizosphaerae]|uniref:Lipocalin-like domain-containing protein n=1 Tax=Arachidicoccus rhizosphaerae TaxID=551991 RepID=A0A1H3Z4I0_9BACT|nr:hypothetical protein [Arachidicoccus rhizosphaerae]SEA18550.1 hypothetical protein SAMN05192529_11012 [Arachidicoccus rhizosphaerae]
MKYLLFILATITLFSCKKDSPSASNDNAKIFGTWETVTTKNGDVYATGYAFFQDNNEAGYISSTGPESVGGNTWFVLNSDRLQVKMSNAEFLDGTITSYSKTKIVINLTAGGTTTLTPGTLPTH